MTTPQHSITTRDVKLWYGKFQALKGINVDIKDGKITSIQTVFDPRAFGPPPGRSAASS